MMNPDARFVRVQNRLLAALLAGLMSVMNGSRAIIGAVGK